MKLAVTIIAILIIAYVYALIAVRTGTTELPNAKRLYTDGDGCNVYRILEDGGYKYYTACPPQE